jgi:hypothetical protein
MTTQTQSGVTNTNQLNPGFPIVGGDTAGNNLVIRSTNSNQKGSVVFDEMTPSFSSNTGAIQTMGGIGAQHNISTGGQFTNMPYGYSVNNILVAPTLGGDYRGYYNLVGTTSVGWTAGVVTMSFQAQTAPPFIVGQFVVVTGVTPTVYNGTWVVTACTSSSVSWTYGTSSPGSLSGYGYMYQTYAGGQIQPQYLIGAPQLIGGSPAQVSPIMNNTVLNITAINTGVITFAAQALPPFVAGQQIYVSNVTPTGYNGTWTVLNCTTTTVSATMGGSAAVGFVTGAGLVSSGYIVGSNVVNPGTGYTNVPSVVVSDPVPNAGNTQLWVGANALGIGAIPQVIATSGASGTGAIPQAGVTSISNVNGTTVTMASTINLAVGQPLVVSGLTGTANGGLTNGTWYFAQYISGSSCQLASSYTNAVWQIPYVFSSSTAVSATLTPTLPSNIAAGYLTISFSALGNGISVVPFYPGQTIVISNTSVSGLPNGYNGTFQVIYATTTSVVIQSTSTSNLSANGIITTAPSNTPTTFVKVAAGSGIFNFYQISYPGTLGTSAPTHIYGTQVPTGGTAGLTYIGSTASAYASIGYSGMVTQGAIHQVGCVNQILVTTAGVGYGSAPTIVLSRPDVPGGRQALASCSVSGGAIQYITIIDAGSGYLYPPTVQFITNGPVATTIATATAVIGNPGEKPIISTFVPPVATGTSANVYSLDFGLTGHNVVFLATGVNSTFYFDNVIASGGTPYTKGFPLGRRIILYVKNTHNASITLTFSNLVNNNAGTSTNAVTLTANKTAKCEFMVLTQGNQIVPGTSYTAVQSYAGGSANDVYATFTLT